MQEFITRVETMLRNNHVEISRLMVTDEEFNEEVVWCLDHQMPDHEIVEHFQNLIADHNDEW